MKEMNMKDTDIEGLRSFIDASPRNRDVLRKIDPVLGASLSKNPMESRRPLAESRDSPATKMWNESISLIEDDIQKSLDLAAHSLTMDFLKPMVKLDDTIAMSKLAVSCVKLADSDIYGVRKLRTNAYVGLVYINVKIVLSGISLMHQDLKLAIVHANLALTGPSSYFENDERKCAMYNLRAGIFGFQKVFVILILALSHGAWGFGYGSFTKTVEYTSKICTCNESLSDWKEGRGTR
jgi:hypothetical protein